MDAAFTALIMQLGLTVGMPCDQNKDLVFMLCMDLTFDQACPITLEDWETGISFACHHYVSKQCAIHLEDLCNEDEEDEE